MSKASPVTRRTAIRAAIAGAAAVATGAAGAPRARRPATWNAWRELAGSSSVPKKSQETGRVVDL